MFGVYVLYSKKYDKIYIGQSSHLKQRIYFHNNGPPKGYTGRFRPWKQIHEEQFAIRKEALRREKELKTARGRRWIWQALLGRKN